MKLHLCIRNNDGTHYQIYGEFSNICLVNNTTDDGTNTTYESLDLGVYDRNDVKITKEHLGHTEVYTNEFISTFAYWSGRNLRINWRAAGSKLDINGFGQV